MLRHNDGVAWRWGACHGCPTHPWHRYRWFRDQRRPCGRGPGRLPERAFAPADPQPARPEPVSRAVADLAQHFAWHGPIGCTFPAIIKRGVAAAAGESGYLPATREPLRNVHQPRYAGAAGAAARRSGSGILAV